MHSQLSYILQPRIGIDQYKLYNFNSLYAEPSAPSCSTSATTTPASNENGR